MSARVNRVVVSPDLRNNHHIERVFMGLPALSRVEMVDLVVILADQLGMSVGHQKQLQAMLDLLADGGKLTVFFIEGHDEGV